MERRRFKPVSYIDPAIAAEAASLGAPADLATPTLHEPKLTKEFLFAGNAHFIVRNPTGEQYTYAVRAREGKGKYQGMVTFFVSVKATGGRFPFRYVGIAKDDGRIIPAGKSEFLPGTKEFDVAEWAFTTVIGGGMLQPGYEIAHLGKCGKCSRTIEFIPGVTDEAFERGICPLCYGALRAKEAV